MMSVGVMQKSNPSLPFSFARFADGFDDHIRKSIRGYDELIDDCISMSEYFVEDDTSVFDIGCSTGTFLLRVREQSLSRAPRVRYVGIDVEPNFAERWKQYSIENFELQLADIREFQIPRKSSFITSIFSLQFIPERDRQEILNQIFRSLVPGGALIVAEKTLSNCSKLHEVLTFIHYDFKRRHFSDGEILEKERSLRALMKPWPEQRIVDSMLAAGFSETNVQPFWRNHGFAAFIAIR
jgi:tRNA (cmo5U34)-methyltransferase